MCLSCDVDVSSFLWIGAASNRDVFEHGHHAGMIL